ncbi:MAG TPA: hypothetical protein VJ842_20450 [Pyrinomonadaceae bacterium]|nr:hypothetical protein [Pyrinomonadaceae bacterium]
MKRPTLYRKRFALLFVFAACAASLLSQASAQDLVLPPQPAPPPMIYLPEDVRTQLSAARDDKARTRLSLELAEARLARAEQQTEQKQFNAATAELGIYQALFEDALQYLHRTSDGGSRSRDLFKRLEQTLHKHAARVEAMRRTTPSEFSGNLLTLIKNLRDLRTEALEAFYGHTVVGANSGGATRSFDPKPISE